MPRNTSPLRYQVSEHDCVPTCFLNALTILFSRAEIPPDVILKVYMGSLNRLEAYSGGKDPSLLEVLGDWLSARKGFGTSQVGVTDLAATLSDYKSKDYPRFAIEAKPLDKKAVAVDVGSRLLAWIENGGVALCRVIPDHYVLVTGADNDSVFVFDPLYRKRLPNTKGNVDFVVGNPRANLQIRTAWLESDKKGNKFCLGPTEEREVLLVQKASRK